MEEHIGGGDIEVKLFVATEEEEPILDRQLTGVLRISSADAATLRDWLTDGEIELLYEDGEEAHPARQIDLTIVPRI